MEREGRERKGEKEKERKIGEALSFHLDETPLQPSTALSPREFPSSFISRHERKKKKVGASRIEHATPSVATLVNFKIAQDDSNKLCLSPLWFFARRCQRARPLPGGHSSVPIWAPYILLVPGGGGWWRWSGRYIGAGVAARVGHKEPSPRRWYNLSALYLSLSLHGYFLSEVWPGRGKERERESAGHLGALKKPTRPWPVRQGRINYASEPGPLTPVSKKIQTRWNAIRYGEMSGLDALTLDPRSPPLPRNAPPGRAHYCNGTCVVEIRFSRSETIKEISGIFYIFGENDRVDRHLSFFKKEFKD